MNEQLRSISIRSVGISIRRERSIKEYSTQILTRDSTNKCDLHRDIQKKAINTCER